jgi:hypothetical protein
MRKLQTIVLVSFAMLFASARLPVAARADDVAPIETTVTVDAQQTLRTMNPRWLGGTNVALWYPGAIYSSPQVRSWMAQLHADYIRLPGGSWSNIVYWNGNGVRGADGTVDPSRVGPDGYPTVDYRAYAPSFVADPKTLHPASTGWHGHVDVKTQQDFIKAIPGTEAMACPNLGTGRPVDAAEWVKWANQTMGYDVRYWELGNELGGGWEPGNDLPFGKGQITAEMYTKRFNDMANAMRKIDPSIKIGGGAFAEQMLRDCGDNVNFVSIHTYPGSTTLGDAQMFSDIKKSLAGEIAPVRKWIHQYQPQREKQIEIAYTEWNLGGGVPKDEMFSGLWASIFLGEMARDGVDLANEWDCFTDMLFTPEGGQFARKPEYDALWLWNNYMGDRLISANSSDPTIYTYASRDDDAAYVMLINTDHERDAKASVQLSGFNPAISGEVVRVTSREYYCNPLTRRPQWSEDPRIEKIQTGSEFGVTLSPFSITYVRIPDRAKPVFSVIAQEAIGAPHPLEASPELRFVMPSEAYVGDDVPCDLIALAGGTEEPYSGTLAPALLSASGPMAFDRSAVRLSESVGHFTLKPTTPGEITISARSGDVMATSRIMVKPSVPRPVVFWDFTKPLVTDKDTFASDFTLAEDQTQRANRAVARVDLPAGGVVPADKANTLLKIQQFPGEDRLKKENIRGVIFDCMTSPDFACDDPNAGILVVMQGPANWWTPLGTIPLKDSQQWNPHQLAVQLEQYLKAMPSAGNIIFLLNANKPVKGSVYFDHIGFLVR